MRPIFPRTNGHSGVGRLLLSRHHSKIVRPAAGELLGTFTEAELKYVGETSEHSLFFVYCVSVLSAVSVSGGEFAPGHSLRARLCQSTSGRIPVGVQSSLPGVKYSCPARLTSCCRRRILTWPNVCIWLKPYFSLATVERSRRHSLRTKHSLHSCFAVSCW